MAAARSEKDSSGKVERIEFIYQPDHHGSLSEESDALLKTVTHAPRNHYPEPYREGFLQAELTFLNNDEVGIGIPAESAKLIVNRPKRDQKGNYNLETHLTYFVNSTNWSKHTFDPSIISLPHQSIVIEKRLTNMPELTFLIETNDWLNITQVRESPEYKEALGKMERLRAYQSRTGFKSKVLLSLLVCLMVGTGVLVITQKGKGN